MEPCRAACEGAAPRVHPDRAVGGDRHHRHPDRPARARRPAGPRVRQRHHLQEQPQAAWPPPSTISTRSTAPCRPTSASTAVGRPAPRRSRPSCSAAAIAHLLPYVEQQPLYQEIMHNIQQTGKNQGNATVVTIPAPSSAPPCPRCRPSTTTAAARGIPPVPGTTTWGPVTDINGFVIYGNVTTGGMHGLLGHHHQKVSHAGNPGPAGRLRPARLRPLLRRRRHLDDRR